MQLLAALALLASTQAARSGNAKYNNVDIAYDEIEKFDDVITPKAVVVNAFAPEGAVWQKHVNFTNNITLPGLSPIYPNVSCTKNYDLCHIITGEGEINAATSISAFLTSAKFNLSESYFLINGIAGIDPHFGGLGSAAFAQYTVSVALQYEVDPREMPKNWTTGYWNYGTESPGHAPGNYYGTEVFELNEKLRNYAAALASKSKLSDSTGAHKTAKLYNISTAKTGAQVLKCDVATSDVYYTGNLLSEAFSNTTKLLTNGTGRYCMSAQEDSAILEAAVRAAKFGLTDYSRWVLLRTGSDFDRPPTYLSNDTVGFFNHNNTGGFEIAIENLYKAGSPFISAILKGWNSTFSNGTFIANATSFANATNATLLNSTLLNGTNSTNNTNSTGPKNGTFAPDNYVGDVFGTLGGEPNFGPGSYKEFAYIAAKK